MTPGGHGHGHGDGKADRRGRWLLAAIIVPFALITLVGLVMLWPSHRHYPVPLQFQAAGGGTVSFVTGEVLASRRDSCTGNSSRTCLVSVVGLKDGRTAGLEFSDGPGAPRLAAGDRVRLARTTDPQTGGPAYVYDDQVRDVPLGLLSPAFAVVVVGVARWRGLAALVGLGVAYGVLVLFLVPALLAGESALAVGLVAGAAILFAVLYLALSGRSVHDIVTGDQVAEEALRTLVGGIGLVAAVPITTAIAVATVTRVRH